MVSSKILLKKRKRRKKKESHSLPSLKTTGLYLSSSSLFFELFHVILHTEYNLYYVVETEIFLKNVSVLLLAQTIVFFGVYICSLCRGKEEVKVETLKEKKKACAAGFTLEQSVIYLRDT